MHELMDLTAVELAACIRRGDASCEQSVAAALGRIAERNEGLNAFVYVDGDAAMAAARKLDACIAAGEDPGPLAGVPFGVKDLEDVCGLVTTFGSLPFRDNVAARDSVQVARLKRAGAIVIGKTNTPEFGCTAYTRNRLFGTTRNPWNLERTPGGSSGGSSAAVAARIVPIATASDGGGSVRIPACYVGAFGFKPTFGRIPVGTEEAHGMLRWVDTVHYGPITRSVEDAALWLDVAAGYDPGDPNSLPAPASSYLEGLAREPAKLRIAYSRDLGYATVDPDVAREVESAVDVLAGLGHEVDEIDSVFSDVATAWAFLCGAEDHAHIASHERVEGHEDQLGRGYWAGLRAASKLTAAQAGAFMKQRAVLNDEISRVLANYDALVTPTCPTAAFAASGPMPREIAGRRLESTLHAVAFTYPFNFSGHPAATLRAGFTDERLPVGLQIVAERHRDDLVLQLSAAYHRERPMCDWPAWE